MTAQLSRREMMGSLGALVAAGGWIGLGAGESIAQDATGDRPREYTLPPLPYAYDALEPTIDGQTMKLHHDIHHNGYVQGLNAALRGLHEARGGGSPDDLAHVRELTDSLAFNGSGHILHTIFWGNMKKGGGGKPTGALARIVDRDFGTFEALQRQFTTAATKVQGSGWGILALEPLSGRLIALAAEKHQNQTIYGCVPLLVIDVWEHAYYLLYQNRRAAYVQNFWNVVDWDNVNERLGTAMKSTL